MSGVKSGSPWKQKREQKGKLGRFLEQSTHLISRSAEGRPFQAKGKVSSPAAAPACAQQGTSPCQRGKSLLPDHTLQDLALQVDKQKEKNDTFKLLER